MCYDLIFCFVLHPIFLYFYQKLKKSKKKNKWKVDTKNVMVCAHFRNTPGCMCLKVCLCEPELLCCCVWTEKTKLFSEIKQQNKQTKGGKLNILGIDLNSYFRE